MGSWCNLVLPINNRGWFVPLKLLKQQKAPKNQNLPQLCCWHSSWSKQESPLDGLISLEPIPALGIDFLTQEWAGRRWKICSMERLNVEAHNPQSIIWALNGKQPQKVVLVLVRPLTKTVNPRLKCQRVSAVRELSPVSPADTKLFHNYLQLELDGLLKSTKVISPRGQRRGPALTKEVNIFFSCFPTVRKLFCLAVLTCDIQTFSVLQLRHLGPSPGTKMPWIRTLIWFR